MSFYNKILKVSRLLLLLLGIVLFNTTFSESKKADIQEVQNDTEIKWITREASGDIKIHLYFFWTKSCPHCQLAKPYVETLAKKTPWLNLHSFSLTDDKSNISRYADMAWELEQEARKVPAFIFCGQMEVGYDQDHTTGVFLTDKLQQCYQAALGGKKNEDVKISTTDTQTAPINIPLLPDIDINSLSLPLLTVVLAGLDSFNPCAFFVLLALMSLLVHARSRARMFAIGGIFVFFSGFIYFLFMVAWLNLFLVIGQLAWVTLAAGIIAVVLAVINIKDFFMFGRGVSLSIRESAKPGLFQRMRGLLQADNWPTMVVGAVTLAIAANSYELLCTAGFPMAFTRILTLHELSPTTHYFYLLLYNIIYIVPLFIIVVLFSLTLGARKLSEKEGRVLKLLSGVMMAELGIVLIFVPELINQVLTAIGLLVGAVSITYVITRFYRLKEYDQR